LNPSPAALRALGRRDRKLGRLLAKLPGFPGFPDRRNPRHRSHWASLTSAIVYQQLHGDRQRDLYDPAAAEHTVADINRDPEQHDRQQRHDQPVRPLRSPRQGVRAIAGWRARQCGKEPSEPGGKEPGEDVDRNDDTKLLVGCRFHDELPKRHHRIGDELGKRLAGHERAPFAALNVDGSDWRGSGPPTMSR
jgi:hypothetical protein